MRPPAGSDNILNACTYSLTLLPLYRTPENMSDSLKTFLVISSGTMRRILILSGLLLLPFGDAIGQETRVSKRVLSAAEVYDLDFINRFLEDQIILPNDPDYTHAVFLDVTEDGFGLNDILILYPSEEHFSLSQSIPEALLNTLVSLNLETDYRINTVRDRSSLLAGEGEAEQDAKKALAGAILGSLLHYYPEGPMEIHLLQREEDIHITFWNYEEDLWAFSPQATLCIQPDMPEPDPLVIRVHEQPEVLSYIDSEGCVVVESMTRGGSIASRSCQ